MEYEHQTDISRPSLFDPAVDGRVTMLDPPARSIGLHDTLRRDRGVLVQMNGLQAGRPFVLADVVTLGRGRHCHLRFDDSTLSRVHARIFRRGGDYWLEDAGSLNGSFVNDRLVKRTRLGDGDRVRLGSGASLRFQIVDEEEQESLVRLYESSVRDGLTGMLNRRHLEERLAAEVAFAVRHGTELSVVMFDLDHFKRINDSRGHLAGDAVLQHVARLVSGALRAEDVLARYGGEEFVVVARGTSAANAAALAERLRAAVEATETPFERTPIRVTLSSGVASLACCAGSREPKELLARADARLYRAKAGGRNRVVAADAPGAAAAADAPGAAAAPDAPDAAAAPDAPGAPESAPAAAAVAAA